MSKDKIGLAIVGLGKYATEQIIPNINHTRHVRLAGLVSGDRMKAEKFANQYGVDKKAIYTYDTMGEMAKNADIDAVYIITPNSLHVPLGIKAAEAGKHVLTEKPMGINVAECEQLIAACRKAGIKLMVGYRSHFEPFNLAAIDMIKKGKIGDIRVITSEHGRQVKPDTDKNDAWRVKKDLAGGGALMDIGIYALQAACYLTGEEPTQVLATQNNPSTDTRRNTMRNTRTSTFTVPRNSSRRRRTNSSTSSSTISTTASTTTCGSTTGAGTPKSSVPGT